MYEHVVCMRIAENLEKLADLVKHDIANKHYTYREIMDAVNTLKLAYNKFDAGDKVSELRELLYMIRKPQKIVLTLPDNNMYAVSTTIEAAIKKYDPYTDTIQYVPADPHYRGPGVTRSIGLYELQRNKVDELILRCTEARGLVYTIHRCPECGNVMAYIQDKKVFGCFNINCKNTLKKEY